MKLADIAVGGRYTAKVSGRIVTVRVVGMREVPPPFNRGNWQNRIKVVNEATGRTTEFKSAARLRAPAPEPDAAERTETFAIDDTGALVRAVVPKRGEPYQHRCSSEAFQAVARAVAESTPGFNLKDLSIAAGVTWTEAAVAFAFLKERGVVAPASGRTNIANGTAPFEHAMLEYHALRERGPA